MLKSLLPCLLFLGLAAEGVANDRPNIILFIADDMNWDDCGSYGHPTIRTPAIDSLASDGMRFQHAYLTCSSCSPSRSSIITGKYPHNTGAEQLHWPLPQGTSTFVGALKKSGYYTASAGKWHLGNAIRDDFDRIYEASTAGFVLPSGADGEPPKMIAAQPSGCEDWEKALTACPKDRPFFLWLAALDPHREYQEGALEPPHKLDEIIVPGHLPDTQEVREDLRKYYDEIGRLDQYVGKVLQLLENRGQAEDTLVLFISDNGRPFPRDKTTLYDGGIRTPWIVRWPAKVAAGQVTEALVSAIDIAPTFLQLAGVDPGELHGMSFESTLLDPQNAERTYAFAEDHWHDYEDHARAIMTQRYKLIRNDYSDLAGTPPADAGRSPTWQAMLKLYDQGKLSIAQMNCFRVPRPGWELYDLTRDPGETKNLAFDTAYSGVLQNLKSELATWSDRTGDYLPTRRTPDEFDRITGQPDHSVRIRPRPSKLQMFGKNGKY
ncbi:MAG: sulfatase [Planctomycetota bacterium]